MIIIILRMKIPKKKEFILIDLYSYVEVVYL